MEWIRKPLRWRLPATAYPKSDVLARLSNRPEPNLVTAVIHQRRDNLLSLAILVIAILTLSWGSTMALNWLREITDQFDPIVILSAVLALFFIIVLSTVGLVTWYVNRMMRMQVIVTLYHLIGVLDSSPELWGRRSYMSQLNSRLSTLAFRVERSWKSGRTYIRDVDRALKLEMLSRGVTIRELTVWVFSPQSQTRNDLLVTLEKRLAAGIENRWLDFPAASIEAEPARFWAATLWRWVGAGATICVLAIAQVFWPQMLTQAAILPVIAVTIVVSLLNRSGIPNESLSVGMRLADQTKPQPLDGRETPNR